MRRSHSTVKRVRTVYVEKLIFFVAAMIIALILSIIAGRRYRKAIPYGILQVPMQTKVHL